MNQERKKFIDIIVGAGEGSNLILDDEYMSTRHARFIAYYDNTVTVEDLGTTNGTWVNGVCITAARELQPGDKVRIGHTDIPIPTMDEMMEKATVHL